MKIEVKYHDERRHIEDICLLYRNEDVILLHINMRTKNRTIDAFGGATDEEVQSIWIGMNEIQMTLPPDFHDNHIFAEGSRYTIYVAIFKHRLLEEMTTPGGKDGVCLWEDPDWEENNDREDNR